MTISDHSAQLEAALRECDGLTRDNQELCAELERKSTELRVVIETHAAQVAEIASLAAERDALAVTRDRLQVELEEARSRAAEIDAALRALTSSRSWRLTKPLRLAGKLARRKK